MSGGFARLTVIGNLGRDPEVRRLNNGNTVVNMTVAASKSWRDKSSGERRERTEWVPVVIYNEGLGKVAEQYLKKGSKVYVEGDFQIRKWQKDGVDHYTAECVLNTFGGTMILLGDAAGSGQRDNGDAQRARGSGGQEGRDDRTSDRRVPPKDTQRRTLAEELDDEIPF